MSYVIKFRNGKYLAFNDGTPVFVSLKGARRFDRYERAAMEFGCIDHAYDPRIRCVKAKAPTPAAWLVVFADGSRYAYTDHSCAADIADRAEGSRMLALYLVAKGKPCL